MDIARLFDCPLCTGIPEREREQFIEGFDYSVKSYMKGDVVFRQGDVCRFLYILLEGEVEAEMTDDSGAMLRIEAIRAPRALAPAFLFAEDNHFPVTATVSEKADVFIATKESVFRQMGRYESFLRNFLSVNANRTFMPRVAITTSAPFRRVRKYLLTVARLKPLHSSSTDRRLLF